MNPVVEEFISTEVLPRIPDEIRDERLDKPINIIARAAKRRKVTVTRTHGNHFLLGSGKSVIGSVRGGSTSMTSHVAQRITASASLTRKCLERANVPYATDRTDDVEGLHWEVLVIGEEASSAIVKIPLFGVGDGKSSFAQLCASAEELRNIQRYMRRFPVEDEDYVQADPSQLNADGTTRAGKIYQVSQSLDHRRGGLTINLTADLPRDIAELAINARWAIPGCRAAIVTIIAPDRHSAEGAVVTSLTPDINFLVQQFTWLGRVRSLAGAMVESMAS